MGEPDPRSQEWPCVDAPEALSQTQEPSAAASDEPMRGAPPSLLFGASSPLRALLGEPATRPRRRSFLDGPDSRHSRGTSHGTLVPRSASGNDSGVDSDSDRAPKRRSSLLPIFLIVLVDVLGLTIVLPLLPVYGEHFGASA